jgi:ribosomal-protein-alanine N-acetyltransferase
MGFLGVSCDGEAARTAMIGFWLGGAFHGQGYMREALPSAIDAAFDFLAVDTIEAGAQIDNLKARTLLTDAGMTPVGERMVYTETRDRDEPCMFYAISRTRR